MRATLPDSKSLVVLRVKKLHEPVFLVSIASLRGGGCQENRALICFCVFARGMKVLDSGSGRKHSEGHAQRACDGELRVCQVPL